MHSHLKSKFLKDFYPDDNLLEVLHAPVNNSGITLETLPESFKGGDAFFITDQNQMVKGFSYEDENNKMHAIAEFNPAVAYFDAGFQTMEKVYESRDKILATKSLQNQNVYESRNNAQNFFLRASMCVGNLTSALEAFINMSIERYKGVLHYKGIISNEQAARLNFPQKMENIMQQVYDVDFVFTHPIEYDMVKETIRMRNDFTHLKMGIQTLDTYRVILTKGLNFDYKIALDCCKNYINFYEPKLIEVCDCKGRQHAQ